MRHTTTTILGLALLGALLGWGTHASATTIILGGPSNLGNGNFDTVSQNANGSGPAYLDSSAWVNNVPGSGGTPTMRLEGSTGLFFGTNPTGVAQPTHTIFYLPNWTQYEAGGGNQPGVGAYGPNSYDVYFAGGYAGWGTTLSASLKNVTTATLNPAATYTFTVDYFITPEATWRWWDQGVPTATMNLYVGNSITPLTPTTQGANSWNYNGWATFTKTYSGAQLIGSGPLSVVVGAANMYGQSQADNPFITMDNVTLTEAIPEPSTLLLIGVGGLVMWRGYRRVRR